MTNQCWYPMDIQGRKTIDPEILNKNDEGVTYKEVDFEKEFTWEDVIKGI